LCYEREHVEVQLTLHSLLFVLVVLIVKTRQEY
jgi:hypothetical protein